MWDFKILKMQFRYGDAVVSLKGLKDGLVHIASKKQLSKMSQVVEKGTCAMLMIEKSTV